MNVYCGEDHTLAKLTRAEVLEIKEMARKSDLSMRQIGEMFGVSKTTVFDIKAGRTWASALAENDELPSSTEAVSSTAIVEQVK
jgi:predicted DNA-binding protein YlxM (UPF0122 family)